jgi:hypothetical protein
LSLCSHRNKPAVFCNHTLYFFCNHLLPKFAIIFQITKTGFQPQTNSGFLFLQPHIIIVCNHTQNIVAITHWFSFFLSLLQSQK